MGAPIGAVAGVLIFADQPGGGKLGGVACCALSYLIAGRAWDQLPRWLPLTGYALTGIATALVFLLAHSARLSDLATLLTVSLAAVTATNLLRHGDVYNCLPVLAIYVPGLVFTGMHETYSEVPPIAFALLVIAPWAAGFVFLAPLFRTLRPRIITHAGVALLWLTLLGLAVGLAFQYESLEF